MSRKTDAMKRAFVAIGHGSAANYSGQSVVDVLKELAVVLQCAPSVADIRATKITGVLDFIADNYGAETKEPFDLTETKTHATVTYKINGKNATAGNDKLYNGDKVKITATADTGYEVTTLTANGTAISSGDTVTVNGAGIAVVATGTLSTFYLARTATNCTVTVTKNGEAVSDGDDALTYGDVITISATAAEGYTMESLLVNGETFVSGETLTVNGNVNIVATAEETAAE